jgi:hypothetical protein
MTATSFNLNHMTRLSARGDVIELRRHESYVTYSRLAPNQSPTLLKDDCDKYVHQEFHSFFLSAFEHLRKAPNSFVKSVCLSNRPSVCPSCYLLAFNSTDFRENLILETSINICLERRNLVQIRQKYRALCVKT